LTLSTLYQQGVQILKDAHIHSYSLDALLLLCFSLHIQKNTFYTHPERTIFPSDAQKFIQQIEKRAQKTPLQYITGIQEFMSLTFMVNPHVLIPRPDTEVCVEAVLKKYSHTKDPLSILELGTGSGCIAVSLAKYLPNATITATDISSEALDVAKENAKRNTVLEKIQFIKSDLFSHIPPQKFDVVISNPPYIPSAHIKTLSVEVKDHEPLLALDGGEDGYLFYRSILPKAKDHLLPNGIVILEVGIGQAQTVAEQMASSFSNVQVVLDLSQIPRVVMGTQGG
jgi:release factor glutamine methyltransferase